MDTNKCGFKIIQAIVKPPYRAFFNASCQIHDDNYTIGGTEADRLKADLGFLWRMLEDCNKIEDYNKKKKAVRHAILYYILVRVV